MPPTIAEIIEKTREAASYKRAVEKDNMSLVESFKRRNKFWQMLHDKKTFTRPD